MCPQYSLTNQNLHKDFKGLWTKGGLAAVYKHLSPHDTPKDYCLFANLK